MKNRSLIILIIVLFSSFSHAQETNPLKLSFVKGVTSIPATYLVEQKEKYDCHFYNTIEEAVYDLSYGDSDGTILSYKSAKQLKSRNPDSIMIIAELSKVDYGLVSSKKDSGNLSALLGKTVYVVKDSRGEELFLELLKHSGIPTGNSAGCVNVENKYTLEQIVSMFLNGKIDYAVLGGKAKNTVLKRKKIVYESLSLLDEFNSMTGVKKLESETVFVIRTQVFQEKEEQVLQLLQDLELSVSLAKNNPEITAQIIKQNKMGFAGQYSSSLISNANLQFTSLIAK